MEEILVLLNRVVEDLKSKVNTGIGPGSGPVHESEEMLVSKGKAPTRPKPLRPNKGKAKMRMGQNL